MKKILIVTIILSLNSALIPSASAYATRVLEFQNTKSKRRQVGQYWDPSNIINRRSQRINQMRQEPSSRVRKFLDNPERSMARDVDPCADLPTGIAHARCLHRKNNVDERRRTRTFQRSLQDFYQIPSEVDRSWIPGDEIHERKSMEWWQS